MNTLFISTNKHLVHLNMEMRAKRCDSIHLSMHMEPLLHVLVHAAMNTPETQKMTRRDGADKGRHNEKPTTAGRPSQAAPQTKRVTNRELMSSRINMLGILSMSP